eukprot:scaffold77399_cov76-Phaeocystis_antarctica.AAC.10
MLVLEEEEAKAEAEVVVVTAAAAPAVGGLPGSAVPGWDGGRERGHRHLRDASQHSPCQCCSRGGPLASLQSPRDQHR